ncbi:hypothetical protein Tco_0906022 [Tanacetum coccineum]
MVTDLEDPKTHIVDGVWSGEYMDHGFAKSMKELDGCYTMLEELRFVIVGGALIHKNREGSKLEGRRIRPTIGDFGGNCFRVDVKRKSTEVKVRSEKVFEVDEALDIENSGVSSLQVRGNVGDTWMELKTKQRRGNLQLASELRVDSWLIRVVKQAQIHP